METTMITDAGLLMPYDDWLRSRADQIARGDVVVGMSIKSSDGNHVMMGYAIRKVIPKHKKLARLLSEGWLVRTFGSGMVDFVSLDDIGLSLRFEDMSDEHQATVNASLAEAEKQIKVKKGKNNGYNN